MLKPLITASILTAAMVLPAQGHGRGRGHGNPHDQGGQFVPPGLAKKGGLPPGLAKKFGRRVPEQPYIAIDPLHKDRAYFLIDGRWELRKGFTASIQAEIGDALQLPMAPPPVPLPNIGVDLHVVLFK
ncbi:MAG TPA: hypothetical protein VJ483_02155 [Holophagaceae bacterium]|nr:hypothetical protein [Holophagaceae bacterium]